MTIKEMRDALGVSQNKFADIVGISVRNIQTWEQGVRKPPNYVLNLIEKVLRYEGLLK